MALERFRFFLGHLLAQGDHLELIVELGFSGLGSDACLFGILGLSTLVGEVLLDLEEAGCERGLGRGGQPSDVEAGT